MGLVVGMGGGILFDGILGAIISNVTGLYALKTVAKSGKKKILYVVSAKFNMIE